MFYNIEINIIQKGETMPTVIININSNIDDFYRSIQESLDARYHQSGNSFPTFKLSDQELADIATLSAYASHASDKLHVNGVHIERLIT